ncbi:MAG: nucleotidyltransferase domain-containing protein [Cyanobacteria bacterium K_DeepCast_35m_m1_288]|nr:nucleotidyltransferase domain-containing protein [Cyanobacteria bacterium K_DeepCast_35m_m1_288]
MASSPATRFSAPAIPWLEPQRLAEQLELGPGLDTASLRNALIVLARQPQVQALVAFGSRVRGDARLDSDLDLAVICREPSLTPAEKTERSFGYRQLLGSVGVGVDLVVVGAADAQHLAGSRWHVMGDVAREGRVLYVAG